MSHLERLDRRAFIRNASLAAAVIGAAPVLQAAEPAPKFKIIAFSKPFRTLPPKETADLVSEIGWDGLEFPVREKSGHVLPQKVEEELPRFVEALKKAGKEIHLVTTEVKEVNALNEKVLRTAAKLGITKYRLGFWNYSKEKPIAAQVSEIAAKLKDLAALNKELGLQAGFQNHSGANYVGAGIWDVWHMIKDLDPKQMGFCFDIGHATLEGGLSWPTEFRAAQDRLTCVFFKDFAWEKDKEGFKPVWCPLGQGAVRSNFVKLIKESGYTGALCQHHEYKEAEGNEMIPSFKKDLATLRKWLGQS